MIERMTTRTNKNGNALQVEINHEARTVERGYYLFRRDSDMKLTNPKTFEKWCEKNNFCAGAMLEAVERWASECGGNFGSNNIEYETGRTTACGRPETIRFDLVRAALVEVRNADGEIIGAYRTNEPWTFGDGDYIDGTIEEAVYRFIE